MKNKYFVPITEYEEDENVRKINASLATSGTGNLILQFNGESVIMIEGSGEVTILGLNRNKFDLHYHRRK